MDSLPDNVLRLYSAHFAKVRATIGSSLHKLLDHYGEPKNGELDRKFWQLLDRLHDWRQRYCPKLLTTDRFVRAYWGVRGDVQSDGFEHYFEYSSGDTWADLLRLLELGGDEQACNHFRRALAVFPNSTPSLDQAERAKQLETLNRQRPETSELLSKLDSEYYDAAYPSDDTLYRALRKLEDEEVVPDLPIPS